MRDNCSDEADQALLHHNNITNGSAGQQQKTPKKRTRTSFRRPLLRRPKPPAEIDFCISRLNFDENFCQKLCVTVMLLTGLVLVCLLAFSDGGGDGEQNQISLQQSVDQLTATVAEQQKELQALDGHSNATADVAAVDNQTTSTTTTQRPVLPEKNAQEQEHKSGMAIFFILFIIAISIMLVHVLAVNHLHYVPESLAVVVLGAVIGFVVKLANFDAALQEAEAFSANAFFLVLLPPIIFESGYNLHKGNFFANIGSILVFACVGTTVSAVVVGGGIYILGQADLVYALSGVHSFAFGAMISAVDPVATLAIFQALSVEPLLYMLVFGESVLNDAVAIVLCNTVLELRDPSMRDLSVAMQFAMSFWRFLLVFFGSALIGIAAALVSALLLKHVDIRRTPSLELAMLFVFAYLPYALAEGLHLSGIMAILFCGIGMSHYTHFNLSPMTQISTQQMFRTLAFVAETCIFAYLGLAMFTFPLVFKPVLIIWGIVLILVGRAVNIFPLAWLCNRFRVHTITPKMQFIMWFSGLRGAIAFALSLFTDFGDPLTRRIVITNTLIIVLFTTMFLGGSTLPLISVGPPVTRNEHPG